jgi:hypothetical protein
VEWYWKMNRRNKFGICLKGIAVGLTVAAVAAAQADQWDLGTLTLNFNSFNPGLYGDINTVSNTSGTWREPAPSNFAGWAGVINWNGSGTAITASGVPSVLQTMCSSFGQDFNPTNGPFLTELYALKNATAGTTTITLGNTTTTISLPTDDTSLTPPETGTTFLQAGALFGKEYASASNSAMTAAALQLAIWQVLYQSAASVTPVMGSAAFTNQEGAYVSEAAAFTGGNNYGGFLTNVQWADYSGLSSEQGQGQFRIAAGTPEPFTLVLGAAGLLFAVSRRMSARKA